MFPDDPIVTSVVGGISVVAWFLILREVRQAHEDEPPAPEPPVQIVGAARNRRHRPSSTPKPVLLLPPAPPPPPPAVVEVRQSPDADIEKRIQRIVELTRSRERIVLTYSSELQQHPELEQEIDRLFEAKRLALLEGE